VVLDVPKANRITPAKRPTAEQRREGEARRKIAFILVWAFLALITLDIIAPVVTVRMLGSATGEIDAVRTISEEIAPLITAVVGVLGFVLGYYFKSEEKDKP
jgi:Na+-transporting methylmalonyl-CoA/oxaloacetate decarboxylase beta subunit